MNSVELIKELCKERKLPISRLERDLGYGNGYIGQLRKGSLPSDRAVEIANYLKIDLQYLLSGGQESGHEGYEVFVKLLNNSGKRAADVSRATGIPASTFSDWKKGKSAPKQDKLEKIADYFGVTLDYLRTGESEGSNNPNDLTVELDNMRKKLLNSEISPLFYEGKLIDENRLAALRSILEITIEDTKAPSENQKKRLNAYSEKFKKDETE